MFADFQEAVVIVAGDALFVLAAFYLAGAVLLALYHAVAAAVQRYLS